jgi:membrane protein involved in colicin uptake
MTAFFCGAAVAATVAGILVYVIKNQNKPLVNDEYAYEHNTSVREMQSLIENDDRNVDSLAPELSRPREDLNPFVIVEEKGSVSSKSEGSSANISKNEDSASPEKKIVISDEDSADIVTGATSKSSGLNDTGETVDKLRAEANIEAKAKDIAENNARHENLIKAEEKLKVEADAKANLESAKKAAEEKAKAEAEAKAKLEAEKKAAEEKAKAEAEAKANLESAKKAAEEKAKAEAEAKAKLEAAKKAAEEKAKAEAEAKAKLEAEKKAAEAKAKAEAEAKAKLEAEKKAAEEKAKAEAEAKAKLEVAKKAAEEKAKAEAEAKAKLEAAKKAAEEKAKAEAEAKAKLEAAKKAVEEKAKAEAEAKAKLEAEKKAAEAKAKAEAEAKAKLDAAKKAAEEKARADAQHKKQEERNSQSVTGDNKQLPFEELNDSHYTVQLVATSKKDEAQRVARKVGNSWVLFRKKDQQYIVMYGDFKDRSSATQSISGLPETIRKTKPWAKNIAAVKKEIQ